jgi:TonB family protein
MPKNFRFWGNVALIATAHVAIIIGLIHWSRAEKDAGAQSIVWMSSGAGDGVVLEKRSIPSPTRPPRTESKTETLKERDLDEDSPVLASATSEIQLSTPTATPIRTPSPRSTSTPKPSASPEVKGTPKRKPKPTPKPTAKPTPKPSPKKIVLAKASPKPSAKPAPEKEESEPAEGPIEKKEVAQEELPEIEPKKSVATQTGSGKGTSSGTGGGHAGGGASSGQFAWYGSMLHDRFYSEWVQPTNVASAGAKNSVLVKLRIEKDGRISSFEVVRPSGNAELDESVKTLANRVNHVEPLPDGLAKGDHYDVRINFELNSE